MCFRCVSANTKGKVLVLGDVVMGGALEEVRFNLWCHNTEFGYQYYLEVLQPSCSLPPQLTHDL